MGDDAYQAALLLAQNYRTVYGERALNVAVKDYLEGSLTLRSVLAILAD
jgi:hypothetical protein